MKLKHYHLRDNASSYNISLLSRIIKYEVSSLSVSENFIRKANNINILNNTSLIRITQKMRVQDIIAENKELDEAPVGLLKQVGRKLGAKAAGAVGMKGTAAKLQGAADVGDEARELAVGLQGYLGRTGGNPKQVQGPQLAAFLKSQGYPNMHLKGIEGVMTKGQVDKAIMQAAQDAAKADGDPSKGASTAPAQPGSPTAGAAKGQGTSVAGKPTSPQVDKNKDGKDDATGEPMGAAPVDANKDGKDDATGKVIPMPVKGKAAAAIPADLQKQLDALTPTEKKVLAGAL